MTQFILMRLVCFTAGFDGFDTGFDTPFGHSTQAFGLLNPVPLRYSTQVATPYNGAFAYGARSAAFREHNAFFRDFFCL